MAAIEKPASTGCVAWAKLQAAKLPVAYNAVSNVVVCPVGYLYAKIQQGLTAITPSKVDFIAKVLPPVILVGGAAKLAQEGNKYVFKDYGPSQYAKTSVWVARGAIVVSSVTVYGVLSILLDKKGAVGQAIALSISGLLAYRALTSNTNALYLANLAQIAAEGIESAAKQASLAVRAELDTAKNNLNVAAAKLGEAAETYYRAEILPMMAALEERAPIQWVGTLKKTVNPEYTAWEARIAKVKEDLKGAETKWQNLVEKVDETLVSAYNTTKAAVEELQTKLQAAEAVRAAALPKLEAAQKAREDEAKKKAALV